MDAESKPVPSAKGGRKYKILMFSAKDSGGAGIAAYRLHRGLIELGHDSKMIVLDKAHENDDTVGLLQLNHKGKILEPIHSFGYALTTAQFEVNNIPNKPAGYEMFSNVPSQVSFTFFADMIAEADIINFHWCAGMFDYKSAPQLLAGKKIVWTLHDMNHITGGCHYSAGCEKYRLVEGCSACPQLGEAASIDLARRNWNVKKRILGPLDVSVVTPSRWLGDCASHSSIMSGKRVEVIPYGLPLDKFHPTPMSLAREKLKLHTEDKIVLFGCEYINNRRKGVDLLLNALMKLPDYLEEPDRVTLVVFGRGDLPKNLPFKIVSAGLVNGDENLAMLYSAADLYVISSREDNLPNVVLESLACGTPVAGFGIGGIADMVDHMETGWLAPGFDCSELAKGIAWSLVNLDKNRDTALKCRKVAEERYALDIQAVRYTAFFDELYGNLSGLRQVEKCSVPSQRAATSSNAKNSGYIP